MVRYIVLLDSIVTIYLLKIRLDIVDSLSFSFTIRCTFYNLLFSRVANSLDTKNSILSVYILTTLKAFFFIVINK